MTTAPKAWTAPEITLLRSAGDAASQLKSYDAFEGSGSGPSGVD
jgi:hypothetical protein